MGKRDVTVPVNTTGRGSISAARATWLASLGAGLEYYDFVVYGMLAGTLGKLFFPGADRMAGLAQAFGIFAMGYLARPVGGVLFGMAGDRLGRRKIFPAVMFLMAFSTLAIGLLPVPVGGGGWPVVGLVVLRLLQGLSFGAELPGAVAVVSEHGAKKKRGILCGLVISGTCLGSILAYLVLYGLNKQLKPEQVLAWGWRLPFLLGGVLAFASWYIRAHLPETPEFLETAKNQQGERGRLAPLRETLRHYPRRVLAATGVMFLAACLIIVNLAFPAWLGVNGSYKPSDIFLALTIALAWATVAVPLGGMLSDLLGRRLVVTATGMLFVGLLMVMPKLALQGTFGGLVFFLCLWQTFISLLMGGCLALQASLFPTEVRYTGVALSYNLAYLLAGFSPMLATKLMAWSGTPVSLFWIPGIAAIITVAAVRFTEEASAKTEGK